MRLAVLLLAHDRFGRISRTLIGDKHVAVHLRGSLEHLDRASVAALEAVPAVKYDVPAVEAELDRALDAFAADGPTAAELAEAKAQLRARLEAERGRAGTPDEPKDAALARIARILTRADAVTAEEIQSLAKRVFAKGHRVVIVTEPRK